MTTITGNARVRESVAARLVLAMRPDQSIADTAVPDAQSSPTPGDYAIQVDTHKVLLQAHAFDPANLIGPWRAETVFAVGDVIFETGIDADALLLECTAVTGAEETGAAEPTWDTTPGNTTTDNDVTWETLGTISELSPITQLLYQPVLISAVSPESGSVDGDTTITITGSGFAAGGSVSVSVNGNAATNVTVVSDTEVTCDTPSGTEGSADVTVEVGSDSATLPDAFEYQSSGTWLPTELTGLLIWHHTRDPANYTLDVGAGTQWVDLSGNDDHATQSGAASPPLVADSIGGFPAFDFQDDSHHFDSPLSDAHGEYVIFAMLDPDGVGFREYVFTAESPLFGVAHSGGSDDVASYNGSWQNYGDPQTGVQSLLWNLVEGSGAAEAFRNGASIGTATWSSHGISGTQVSIGNRPDQDQELNGRIGELLIVRAPLSQDDIDKIVGYAHHAWDRADLLPAGHPYKSVAP